MNSICYRKLKDKEFIFYLHVYFFHNSLPNTLNTDDDY